MAFSDAFIRATEEYTTLERPIPAPYLRRSFTAAAGKASLRVAACGFYELYVNGERCTKGRLAPYISNPDDLVYYDTYELTLCAGENVIGLWLGNGFQNNPGGYIWDFDKAVFRGAPCVAAELTYTAEDGTEHTLLSDTSFRTAPSPLLFDDYRFGERYDARLEQPGWSCPGFDDSGWRAAFPAPRPRGALRRCAADPIREAEERAPVRIWPEDDGFIYDFGVSDAGVCRLTLRGTPGQTVSFQHADALKDGRFYLNNNWFVLGEEQWERDRQLVHKDTYICRGEGTEQYTPCFTYHGFRYVKVTGITAEQAVPELLTCVTLHSALRSRGGFSCSDETANRLQEMVRRSDLSNFHYFPTDCPQREKNGWTADAALSSEQVLLNFAAENSYREWMRSICLAQNADGALPGIVPTGGWGFHWGNGPAWDSVLAYLPYYVYVYRGETEMIRESSRAFMAYLHYLTTRTDENGLMHIGLGDWCHVGREASAFKAPLVVTDTILSMDIARKMAVMLGAIGLTAQQAFAQTLADGFRAAFRRRCIDFGTMTVAGNCQTCQAMALHYGLFTEGEAPAAFEQLLRMVHEADDHMDVGVLGGRVLFRVLSDFGQSDLAFTLITRPDFPSYGNWVARGATTMWEDFFPDTVSSMNHHFWGDISAWFLRYPAGIRVNPQGDNVHTAEISPTFLRALDRAEGFHEMPDGILRSAWKRDGREILLTLEIPDGVRATLRLRPGYTFEDGTAFAEAHSGTYRIIGQ